MRSVPIIKLARIGFALQMNKIPAKNPIGIRSDFFFNFMFLPSKYAAENNFL